jgi:tetrahydromethanopterin S-methyltransferase subunit D
MSLCASRTAIWAVFGLLALIAGFAWLGYIGNAMAYGDVLGLPGREKDITIFGAKAMRSLFVALAAEGLAVGAITWNIAGIDTPTWRRLAKASIIASVATVFTFALVRKM